MAMRPHENTRKIARNSLLLYARLLVLMVVSLYTVRIVLRVLGDTDYGIYNLVAGVVVLFAFLNTAMSTATQRFLSFELGRGNKRETGRVFSMSMTAHAAIALVVVILAETVGLWFLNFKLNIPPERMYAANWVYQLTVLTTCVNILRVPYNASIISYERMSFYALLSIAEAGLKLMAVALLLWYGYDKLILYAVLTLGVSVVVFIIYKWYCRRCFDTCRYSYFRDKQLFYRLMGFSGWSLFGSAANVGAQQGINILLNIFWGVTVNAAMGIAQQLSAAVYSFVASFQTAFNPQLVKSYAAGETDYLRSLIIRTSKFSYYLMLVISLPVLLNADYLLQLWLGEVPAYSVAFCKLIIVFFLIDAVSAPLWMTVQATGRIRNYQLIMGTIILLNIPVAYILLRMGYSPESALLVRVLINLVAFGVRIFYLRNMAGFSVGLYMRRVILPSLVVSILAFPLPYRLAQSFGGLNGLLFTTLAVMLCVVLTVYCFGLTATERQYVNSLLSGRRNRNTGTDE